jgi:hypothetical protein
VSDDCSVGDESTDVIGDYACKKFIGTFALNQSVEKVLFKDRVKWVEVGLQEEVLSVSQPILYRHPFQQLDLCALFLDPWPILFVR